MKDVGYSIRKAYFDKLNNNITIGGNIVPIYDNVPGNAEYPYIQVANVSVVDNSTKDNFNNNCVVTVQVYTGTDGSSYSRLDVDNLSNQVMQRLLDRTSLPNAAPDFKVITNLLESTGYIDSQFDGFYEVRKIIRIRNIVEQL
jgi:hypothetical protein